MGPRRFVLLCAVAASLAVPRIAAAASEVFMCVDGIEGGSTDEDFAGCSKIIAVSYSVGLEGGAPPPVGAGGDRSPRPTCGLYIVSKAIDVGSVPLLIRSLRGQRTAEVEFAVRTRAAEPIVFFQLVLSDVLIVKIEQNLKSQADSPLEKIVMQAGDVEWRFIPQDQNGAAGEPVAGGFDCRRS